MIFLLRGFLGQQDERAALAFGLLERTTCNPS
jgi:hypothetical protein